MQMFYYRKADIRYHRIVVQIAVSWLKTHKSGTANSELPSSEGWSQRLCTGKPEGYWNRSFPPELMLHGDAW